MKTGAILTKTRTYQTRDTLNALKLAKLAIAMKEWRDKNQNNKSAAVQRHVKTIKEVL